MQAVYTATRRDHNRWDESLCSRIRASERLLNGSNYLENIDVNTTTTTSSMHNSNISPPLVLKVIQTNRKDRKEI